MTAQINLYGTLSFLELDRTSYSLSYSMERVGWTFDRMNKVKMSWQGMRVNKR